MVKNPNDNHTAQNEQDLLPENEEQEQTEEEQNQEQIEEANLIPIENEQQAQQEMQLQLERQAVKAKIFILLSLNGLRDFIWEYFTLSKFNPSMEVTEDVTEQWLGQQAAASAVVITAIPLIALTANKLYDIPYTLALRYSVIFAAATLAAIVPWNTFQQLGAEIGENFSDDPDMINLISGILPGPGLAESPTQTIVINLLGKILDPFYKFNLAEFVASNLYVVPGNLWQLINTAGVYFGAASSTVIKTVTSASVAVGVGIANFSACKLSDKVGECYNQWKAKKELAKEQNTICYSQNDSNVLFTNHTINPAHEEERVPLLQDVRFAN